jgi:hypothetical protein
MGTEQAIVYYYFNKQHQFKSYLPKAEYSEKILAIIGGLHA